MLVLLYLQYNVYDLPVPAALRLQSPHTQGVQLLFFSKSHPHGLECQIIVLTSEIGHCGATGVVLLRGTLQLEIWDAASTLDVVVKLPFGH